ncbi:MAG: cardiolipin synthase [Thermoplasmata archaeon]
MIDILYLVVVLLLTVDTVAIATLILAERRDPQSVLTWLVVIVALPFVGFALYMLFGFTYFNERKFSFKTRRDQEFLDRIAKAQELGAPVELGHHNLGDLDDHPDLARMLLVDGAAFLTTGNQVDVFTDGNAKFDALFEAIEGAKKNINLEYYILRNDVLGQKLVRALDRKAQEGIAVRLLYDDMGNKIPAKGFRDLRAHGGKVSSFYHALIPSVGLRVNYRNHRKIAVIDGTVGFLGGFNVGTEYLGEGPLGAWRDTAVRIRGSGARALQLRFVLDWNYATHEGLTLGADFFPEAPSLGPCAIQIVSGGPDTRWNPPHQEYLKMISTAKRTFYLQTPYFIPDASVLMELRIAALAGVDVRIMIPTKPDHPFVHWASLSYLGELLGAGVRGFSYDAGFLHAKTATVDDFATSIGTANWDIRSFKWNFETNAVIYDRKLAAEYRAIFEDDMTRCTEITKEWYATRGEWINLRESVSRLFSAAL